MAFFNAMENHYSHRVEYNVSDTLFSGLDSWFQTKDSLEPILDKNNTFSDFMFTERANEIIENHNKTKPLFLYFAAQTPHIDHEYNTPEKYSNKYPHVKDIKRKKLLGLISILDESIGNLTAKLKKENLYDDTLIYFLSDNGGEIRETGRNFPLRGGKRTVFEGGQRVRAFVHGKDLKPLKYEGMFHSVDLLPTIMSSALNRPVEFKGIDGVNQWDSITKNKPSKRNSFIYSIDPLGNLGCSKFTEAIRDGDWKLIKGCPGIYADWYNLKEFDMSKYRSYEGVNMSISYTDASCIDSKKSSVSSYFLFNIKEDPLEHDNKAEEMPCKVKELEIKLEAYRNNTVPPFLFYNNFDPKSNPAKFGDTWSPGWC